MRLKRGQIWSTDMLIAVIIFLLAIATLYFFTSSKLGGDHAKLQIESENVADKLTGNDELSILSGTSIDEAKLTRLVNKSVLEYNKLKGELGVKGDFCIVLRDQEGRIILLNNGTANFVGIGQENLTINMSDGITVEEYYCGAIYRP